MKYLYLISIVLLFPLLSSGQATLIAHWDFNGTTNDVTGNGLNGVGTNVTSVPGFSGMPNTAYSFNGTSSKIDVPYTPLMNLSSWSITALIKPTGYYAGSCQANYILSRGHEYTNDYYALYFLDNPYDENCNLFTPDSEVVEAMPAGNNVAYSPQFASGQLVHLNTWYCIAATYANDTIRVYINGNFSVAVYWTNQYGPGTNADMSIGYYNYGLPSFPYYYNGVIDDIRLYSGPLSQSQLDSTCAAIESVDTFTNYDFVDTVDCNHLTFTANHISGNVADHYLWFFGDNSTGTTNPVTHSYTLAGTYMVKLVVTDILGNTDTITHQVFVSSGSFDYNILDTIHNCHDVQLTAQYVTGETASQITWVFGDNTPNGSGTTVNHTYAQDGNYTVSLIVTNIFACSDTFTLPLALVPNMNYSVADSQVDCKTVYLNASYLNGDTTVQYSWLFSDNTTATGNPVNHSFAQSGSYSASLIVTNSIGCADTILHPFVLTTNINYSISDSLINCKTAKFRATHLGGDTATLFQWYFDDNTTATGDTITHIFPQSGAHTLSLVVTNAQGCRDTFTHAFTLSTNINYTIADSAIDCKTTKLNASYVNGDPGTQFLWLFSDNTTATGNPVTHAFQQPGTYTATLVITGTAGCSDTMTHLLTLSTNFNYSITDSAISCRSAKLTANYVNGDVATQFLWLFDDNTTQPGNPVIHLFPQQGTYNVRLVVTGVNGCNDTSTHALTLVSDIHYDATDSAINCKTVRLVANHLSGDVASQVLWLFSDSTTATGSPVIHVFSQNGSYTVSLVAINAQGCTDTISHAFTLPVNIGYSISDSSIDCKTAQLSATYASGDTAAGFVWLFPNGDTGSTNPIVHTFQHTGANNAALVMINALGCRDTMSYNFVINYTIAADFNFEPATPEKNKPTHFHNASSADAVTFYWDFGDGTHSTEENPVKQYYKSGSFDVCLTATDSLGCSGSICKTVKSDVMELIDIPQAFSPNGDGNNDVLFARGFGVKSMSLSIYNRWGQKIFTSTKMDVGWDGTYKGKAQPDEAYVYVLDAVFETGSTVHKQGNVTILR